MIHKARQFFREGLRQRHPKIVLDGHSLTLEALSQLGTGQSKIEVQENTWTLIKQSRDVVNTLASSDEMYFGINTGVGLFSDIKIQNHDLEEYQYNLIRSHATGIGEVLSLDASRRIHALRINTMAKGYTGISIDTFNILLDLFNSGCVPYIPEGGTVGASGDLVPLSHIGLTLFGEGELWNPSTLRYEPSEGVLKMHGLKKATLQAKEGLSLMNGNQFICGVGSIALEQSVTILRSIAAISALSFLSMKGNPQTFDKSVHKIKMHPGQSAIVEVMRELLPYGKTVTSGKDVQNPYSLKCIPQIHGPSLESVISTKDVLEMEMNSGSDNPLIFTEEPYVGYGGNFHGEYPAKQLDCLGLYVHEIGSLSSQRIKRLTNPVKNQGLPAFLTASGGICSGMMTWENVAASLVSENKVLCYPVSCETLETCADKEDHVSMGSISAKKAILISENVASIIAVELMAACQGLQFRFLLEKDFYIHHQGLQRVFEHVKKISPLLTTDRFTVPEYQEILKFITSGELWDMMLEEMPKSFFDIEIPKEQNSHRNQHY